MCGDVRVSGVLNEGRLLSYSGVLSTRLSMQPKDLSLVSTLGNIAVELPENGGYTVTSQTDRLDSELSSAAAHRKRCNAVRQRQRKCGRGYLAGPRIFETAALKCF